MIMILSLINRTCLDMCVDRHLFIQVTVFCSERLMVLIRMQFLNELCPAHREGFILQYQKHLFTLTLFVCRSALIKKYLHFFQLF